MHPDQSRAVVIPTFLGGMQQTYFVGVPNTFFILGLLSCSQIGGSDSLVPHLQHNGNNIIATMAAQVVCGNNVVNPFL